MIASGRDLKQGDVFRWPPHLDTYTIVSDPYIAAQSTSVTAARIKFYIFHPRFNCVYPMVVFSNERMWVLG